MMQVQILNQKITHGSNYYDAYKKLQILNRIKNQQKSNNDKTIDNAFKNEYVNARNDYFAFRKRQKDVLDASGEKINDDVAKADFNWKTKNEEENDNTEDDVRSADNEAMAQNYWNNIKGYIVKLIKDIDSSIQYYDAQYMYNNRINEVDQMQQIYEKNLISEKHKYVENNNLYSRLAYYNMKEEDTYNDILYWLKIVYFILFFVVGYIVFQSPLWKNIKTFIFLFLLLLTPTFFISSITTFINTEFIKTKIKAIYAIYFIVGVLFIGLIYVTANLPFNSSITSDLAKSTKSINPPTMKPTMSINPDAFKPPAKTTRYETTRYETTHSTD